MRQTARHSRSNLKKVNCRDRSMARHRTQAGKNLPQIKYLLLRKRRHHRDRFSHISGQSCDKSAKKVRQTNNFLFFVSLFFSKERQKFLDPTLIRRPGEHEIQVFHQQIKIPSKSNKLKNKQKLFLIQPLHPLDQYRI